MARQLSDTLRPSHFTVGTPLRALQFRFRHPAELPLPFVVVNGPTADALTEKERDHLLAIGIIVPDPKTLQRYVLAEPFTFRHLDQALIAFHALARGLQITCLDAPLERAAA